MHVETVKFTVIMLCSACSSLI